MIRNLLKSVVPVRLRPFVWQCYVFVRAVFSRDSYPTSAQIRELLHCIALDLDPSFRIWRIRRRLERIWRG